MKKMMFLMLTFLVWGAAGINAQVTIGSGENPHSGAVLDLQSTTQGLKLPSVALGDTLTHFGLAEEGAFTKANAAGMLVWNTNPIWGEGVFFWTGFDWRPLRATMGRPGLDLIVGANTYPTWILPNNAGTWMVANSKEGTPDVTTYPGKITGERGYYYTVENAASACPEGWSLPTIEQLEFVFQVLGMVAGQWDRVGWFPYELMAGAVNIFEDGKVSEASLRWDAKAVINDADGHIWTISREQGFSYNHWPQAALKQAASVRCIKDK